MPQVFAVTNRSFERTPDITVYNFKAAYGD